MGDGRSRLMPVIARMVELGVDSLDKQDAVAAIAEAGVDGGAAIKDAIVHGVLTQELNESVNFGIPLSTPTWRVRFGRERSHEIASGISTAIKVVEQEVVETPVTQLVASTITVPRRPRPAFQTATVPSCRVCDVLVRGRREQGFVESSRFPATLRVSTTKAKGIAMTDGMLARGRAGAQGGVGFFSWRRLAGCWRRRRSSGSVAAGRCAGGGVSVSSSWTCGARCWAARRWGHRRFCRGWTRSSMRTQVVYSMRSGQAQDMRSAVSSVRRSAGHLPDILCCRDGAVVGFIHRAKGKPEHGPVAAVRRCLPRYTVGSSPG